MSYTKNVWKNKPSSDTPITAEALNNMEDGIEDVDKRVTELEEGGGGSDDTKMNVENPTGTGSFSMNRKADTTVGDYSTTEGYNCEASGKASHAEGYGFTKASGESSHAEGYGTKAIYTASHAEGALTIASGAYSHAEGKSTTASKESSHAEGDSTTASGNSSHAEGTSTIASGHDSHAEGVLTKASGAISHAEGDSTEALDYQHAQGHCNNTTTATKNSYRGTSYGTAFVIGNGTSDSASNALRVTGNGEIYAQSSTISTGADYAEYFEWEDGNPNAEDRVGYFVTFDEENEEKLRIANGDDYILGIISGLPSVIGNGDEDWKKRFVTDDFGRYITEEFEYTVEERSVDENGEETVKEVTKTGTRWKENPDYDKTKEYVPRKLRKEWSAVGMLGVLSVRDDGTCQANGYCKCSYNGIATVAERGKDTYRVIKRVSENVVKVVLK